MAFVDRWNEYEAAYEELLNWVKDTEKKVKAVTLVATLDEKKTQVKKFKVSIDGSELQSRTNSNLAVSKEE